MSKDIQQQIDQLNGQVVQLYQQGRYEQAIRLATQARDLAYQHLGENHPNFAASLNNLAALYREKGNYTAAEPLYRQAMEIWRKALGEDHSDFATSLNNLALLYDSMGNYAAAEPLYRQAMEINRTALGENHPSFATSLNNLALLYDSMGNYAAAEPLYRQAMEINRTALGENHPRFAASLNNLASLYESMGNYAAAEPLYRQAMEIFRTALGEDHPSFATSLNNLALLYKSMGNYAAAKPLFKQTMEIRGKALGEDHPDFATSLNNLASLYESMGNYTAAEPLYRQAMEINRTALGENHPRFAASLNNLAELYRAIGNYAAAEPLYRQAMEIRRIALGEDHSDFGESLNNLAGLYRAMGNYTAAEPLYRQAMEINRTALGEDHPLFATSLNNLALLCAATAREPEALKLMQRASATDNRMIGQVFSIGSESQRMMYLKTVQPNFDGFLSLVLNNIPDLPVAAHAALELVLRRKAIGAEALAAQRDAVLSGKYPKVEHKLRDLTAMRMQIAQKTLAGPGPEGLNTHQKLLAQWNTQKELMEAELARQIPEMNLEKKLGAVDRQAVTLALPEGTALVEFVRFDVFDFKAVPARGEKEWKPAHYLAFVLIAKDPDNIQMIDLGEADPIDHMIATFRESIIGEADSHGDRGLGALLVEPERTANANSKIELRAIIFDKLLPALGGRKRLLLAPDGDLTRLPFEVLPMEDGRLLIDEYQISYLGAGRDVLRFKAEFNRKPAAPLVAADPDFDLGGIDTPAQTVERQARHSRDLNRSALRFEALPGTQVEGERIAKMLGAQLLLGNAALEAKIKSCRSPRILHLATHGFFLEDQKSDPNEERRGLGAIGAGDGAMGRLAGSRLENPLLRSGLALAGVNTWLKKGNLPAEAEDGVLTAEDVSGLDLLDTELVVLSACETGLGEVRVGEGVFGLRRAFVLAGAKTLVMSLWKVPDEQTRELMEDFYHRILSGQSRADALREAQLAMKAKYPDPLYWGAFICQGDPSPLT